MLKSIAAFIKSKLGISELQNKVDRQNQRIEFLMAYINLVNSDYLSIPQDIEQKVSRDISSSFGIENFDPTIHKNDIMFAGMLHSNPSDLQGVLHSYFKVGANTASQVSQLLKERNIEPASVLDFGSGYGRVSRFLPAFFPNSSVAVSDVKTTATDFVHQKLKLDQVIHNEEAGSFPNKTFDAIFALSVFTHLPKNTFVEWMNTLINSTNPGGALIFTFNNIEDKTHYRGDFHYITQSEEKKFSAIPDSISNDDQYGSTWVSHDFIKETLANHKVEFSDLKRTFVKTQNAFIVIKK